LEAQHLIYSALIVIQHHHGVKLIILVNHQQQVEQQHQLQIVESVLMVVLHKIATLA